MMGFEINRRTQDEPECPSEFAWDRYHHRELAAQEVEALDRHLAGCHRCREGLEERRKGTAAYPDVDFKRLGHVIAEKVQGPHVSAAAPREKRGSHTKRSRQRRVWYAGGASALLTAAAVVAMFWMTPWGQKNTVPTSSGTRDTVRLMGRGGRPQLSVYLKRGATLGRASSGGIFHAGDRLRFGVVVGATAYVRVVGVEANGALYAAAPSVDSAAPASRVIPGEEQLLPGAVELDDSAGEETLHLVACPRPFPLTAVRIDPDNARIIPPVGCAVEPFKLVKRPAP